MIAIVDYNMGNFASVQNMIKKNGESSIVTDDHNQILRAKKLILPGVGHFARGMENLRSKGLIEVLNYKVIEQKTPILGICLGMQLLTTFSEEGNEYGLKWIDAEIIRFNFTSFENQCKVPNMGWHHVMPKKKHVLFEGFEEVPKFYFVHSYYIKPAEEKDILTMTNYEGIEYCSGVKKNNITAFQFHPEKRGAEGIKI